MSKRGRPGGEEVVRAVQLVSGRTPSEAEVADVSLTPLERQVVAMRESMPPHVILLVACGYRAKLYGRDSRAVSRRCGIMCIPGQPFEYSSVPYTRVGLYMRRLVAMGYHVAFADQESAAVRAADGVKSGIFTRTVTQWCSRGTVLPGERIGPAPAGGPGSGGGGGGGGSSATAVTTSHEKNNEENEEEGEENDALETAGAEEEHHPSHPHTSSAREGTGASQQYMCFIRKLNVSTDDAVKAVEVLLVSFVTCVCVTARLESGLQLEDVLRQHDVVEVIFVTPPAPASSSQQQQQQQHVSGGPLDARRCLAALPEAFSTVLHQTLALNLGPTATGEEDGRSVATAVFAAAPADRDELEASVERYLQPYKLDALFRRMEKRTGLSPSAGESSAGAPAAPATMQLPGSTLRALDVFHSSIGPAGALVTLLDRCLTPSGSRELRAWVAAPLVGAAAIAERQAAVTLLLAAGDEGTVDELLRECARAGDLDALIGKLRAQRCPVGEYVRFLRVANAVRLLASAAAGPCAASSFLSRALAGLSGDAVRAFLAAREAEARSAATTPLELLLLPDGPAPPPPSLSEHTASRDAALAALQAELAVVRRTLQLPGLDYRTIAGTPFVIDVPNNKAALQRVPADWTVLSRTKANVRYYTPVVVQENVRLCAARERLAAAAAREWQARQLELVSQPATLAVLSAFIRSVAALDAAHALSRVSAQPGYVAPTVVDFAAAGGDATPDEGSEGDGVNIVGGRHPVLDRAMRRGYVSCDVRIRGGGAWLLTGPNMAGKSALMRMVGLFAVLAQIGCYVPAEAATLPAFSAVFCRMGATDSLLEGASTFLMEMEETSRILRAPSLRTALVLMDELGRGTSSFDGVAVAAASLEFLVARRATTLFVTHYNYLCEPYLAANGKTEEEEGGRRVQCRFMGFTKGEDGRLVFAYRPMPGVTPSSFGVAVARLAGLPASVTELAERMSDAEQKTQEGRQALVQLKAFVKET